MEANTWKGTKETPDNIIDFLLGCGTIEGHWFSEKPEYEQGQFWWRKHLLKNSKLFTDALDTVQKCGKLPSELLEHNQLLQQQIDDLKNNKHQFLWKQPTQRALRSAVMK